MENIGFGRSVTAVTLLNHVINGALGHHTDSTGGRGMGGWGGQYGAIWKC